MLKRATMAVLVLALVAAACSSDDDAADTTTTTADQTTTTAAPVETGTVLTVADSALGEIVVDDEGFTLYVFIPDDGGESTCYDECASAWPPVLTSGKPTALKGVKPGLLGTTKRKGGAKQATYAGHPLYYYAHEGPGDVFCHNVVSFGGNWKVIHGSGKPAD